MKIKMIICVAYLLLLVAGCMAPQGVESTSESEQETALPSKEIQPSFGEVTIDGVKVTAEQIIIRGKTNLPDGVCLNTELWADGGLLTWWPIHDCVSIKHGVWEFEFPLEPETILQPDVQYVVRAYQASKPDRISIFYFDLDSPPMPAP
jgi:hypothetical protein